MLSNETVKIIKRLQMARLSLMKTQPFYAVLLLNVQFSIDPMCETAYTDGKRIAFGPDFIEKISDSELEFVMMHEVLHIALNHCYRTKEDYDFEVFNIACDIVVNSTILYSSGFDLKAITLKDYGVSMHETPSGKEGYLFTAEQVYEMLKAEFPVTAYGGSGENKKGSLKGSGGKKKKKTTQKNLMKMKTAKMAPAEVVKRKRRTAKMAPAEVVKRRMALKNLTKMMTAKMTQGTVAIRRTIRKNQMEMMTMQMIQTGMEKTKIQRKQILLQAIPNNQCPDLTTTRTGIYQNRANPMTLKKKWSNTGFKK